MAFEVARLLFGVLIAIFHRPIGTLTMRQERATTAYFRQRGISLPTLPSDAAAQNLFFFIGIFICLIEMGKIWVLL